MQNLKPELLLFPTIDPIIARHLGSALQKQRAQGKPEHIQIRGTANQAQVQLDIFESERGYRVRGNFGAAAVDHTISDDTRPFDDSRRLAMKGHIGPYPIDVRVHQHRRERPIKHSKALESKATLTARSRVASTATPTFGGAPLQTNLAPTEFPENSPPIVTREEMLIQGDLNGQRLHRFHSWQTTSWTNSYNDDSGAINWEEFRIEEAEQQDRFADCQSELEYQITPGYWALSQANLAELPCRREYKVSEQGLRVQHSLGQWRADYEITPVCHTT